MDERIKNKSISSDVKAEKIAKEFKFPDDREKILVFFAKDVNAYLEGFKKIHKKVASIRVSSEEAVEEFTKLTNKVLDKGEKLEQSIVEKKAVKQIKQLFREVVSDWIYKSQIVNRAYQKPKGYPGDYKTIEIIYDNQPLCKNIKDVGFYVDKYFLNSEYAVSVRNRKSKMRDLLIQFIKTTNSNAIRILNLACGSCREIREMLTNNTLLNSKALFFLCVDHDEEALKFSKKSLENTDENITFNFLKENILDLIRDDSVSDLLGKYNFIYSIGLIDYLPDVALKKLMSFCINLLTSKGILVLTHKDINIYKPLAPNWFCDWNFYSRSEDDIVHLIESLGILDIELEIEREGSQRILFLILRKK